MSTTLPPTLSESALSAALVDFAAALGNARVLTGEGDLKLYRDPFQHAGSDAFRASAVVLPETVEEVQEIVRVANPRRTPVDRLPGPQQRLRWPRASRERLGDREPAQHETRARDRRGLAPMTSPRRSSSRRRSSATASTELT